MEKSLRANKVHKCTNCNVPILKGETHLLIKIRYGVWEVMPGYDKSNPDAPEKQVGIKYEQWRQHNYDCWAPVECQKGNHKYEFHDGMMGDQRIHDECWICLGCGKNKNEETNLTL
jgi:hypothetical protein